MGPVRWVGKTEAGPGMGCWEGCPPRKGNWKLVTRRMGPDFATEDKINSTE